MVKKTIEELNLMSDFLFQEVLGDEESGSLAAGLILSVIMGRPVGEIMVHTQKVMTAADTEKRSIRLDVYVTENLPEVSEEKVIYDIEAQAADTRELPQRSRYYQALVDARQLDVNDPYKALMKLWIILIMPVDVFGKDRMCYTFEHRCIEDLELSLGDGARRVFLYSKGKKGAKKDLAALLQYIENSSEEYAVDETTRKLHQVVKRIKQKHEVGVRYMKAIEYEYLIRERADREGREKGMAEGRAEGRAESKVEDILEILSELGEVPEELRTKISKERNLEILRIWLKLACKADSLEGFAKQIENY